MRPSCCLLLNSTANMITASSDSIADVRDRLRRLKDVELDKYTVSSLSINGASASRRLQSILAARDEVLRAICDVNITGDRGADNAAAVSHAAFIFDKYMSSWIASEAIDLPYRIDRIGAASVFIAAKSRSTRRRVWQLTERYAERNPALHKVFDAELDILAKLEWNTNYQGPIEIVQDVLGLLLPRSTGYQEHDDALVAFKEDVLDDATHLSKLAAVTYGFVTKYPPSTITLAVLMIVLENKRPPSSGNPLRRYCPAWRSCAREAANALCALDGI